MYLLNTIVFARSIEIFSELKGTAASEIMGLRYVLCSGITAAASYFYMGKPSSLGSVLLIATFISCILAGQLVPFFFKTLDGQ